MKSERGESVWRPVFAALGNERTLRLYAQIVLNEPEPGADLSPSRRRHAIAALIGAGLITEQDAGHVARVDAFSRVLRSAPRPIARTGVDRFLTSDGRIDRYPATPRDRRALLEHIVSRSFDADAVLTESEVNERLTGFTDDVATLRRYLVDHELLERLPNGTEYARPATR